MEMCIARTGHTCTIVACYIELLENRRCCDFTDFVVNPLYVIKHYNRTYMRIAVMLSMRRVENGA